MTTADALKPSNRRRNPAPVGVLHPRLMTRFTHFRADGHEIVSRDNALRVFRFVTTNPTGQTVTYQRDGSETRYSYPVNGDVCRMLRALRDLHEAVLRDPAAVAVLRDPAAVAVLTERESELPASKSEQHPKGFTLSGRKELAT